MVRKPVYLQSARDGRERWLISYTDILTLLLILFVAMAAETVGQSQARAVETKPQAASSAAPMTPLQPTPVTEAPQTPAPPAPETAVSQTPRALGALSRCSAERLACSAAPGARAAQATRARSAPGSTRAGHQLAASHPVRIGRRSHQPLGGPHPFRNRRFVARTRQ